MTRYLSSLGTLSRKQRWFAASTGGLIVVGLLTSLGMASRSGDREPLPVPDALAANGTVEGVRKTVDLRPELGGTLAALHVRLGQDVREGELLFELSNETQRAQVALAEAELASAQTQAEEAKGVLNRSRQLVTGRSISQEQYDANHYRNLTMHAKVAEAAARVQLARAELAKTQRRAPWAGRVMQVYVEPGATVGPGSARPVLRLADVSRRRVRALVEERNVARVHVGQQATIASDSAQFSGWAFAGRVSEVAAIMGQTAPQSDDPEEYKDVYFFEVWIDLEGGNELPLNHRVRVRIEMEPAKPQS